MNALVNNLLDMARIQSGEVKLRREWQSVEEVVGSALKSAQPVLARTGSRSRFRKICRSSNSTRS
jgi:two-component system sensor histidine kinase KdpD